MYYFVYSTTAHLRHILNIEFPPSHKQPVFQYKNFPSLLNLIVKDICCKYCRTPPRIFLYGKSDQTLTISKCVCLDFLKNLYL